MQRLLKITGVFALVLGLLVLLVATYVTIDRGQWAVNPMILGVAAILAGFLSLKKASKAN